MSQESLREKWTRCHWQPAPPSPLPSPCARHSAVAMMQAVDECDRVRERLQQVVVAAPVAFVCMCMCMCLSVS